MDAKSPNSAPDTINERPWYLPPEDGRKEPFIKKRETWHTFGLPPGAPPRRGILGFLKYMVDIAR